MKIFYLILTIVFAFFIVTFSQFNSAPVTIRYYYFQDLVVPAYMLIFVALLVGVVITGFLGVVERFRLNRTISKQNKVIRDLRKELREHEAPPMIEDRKKTPVPPA
ncbi:MAG TPA: LapA family protein [Smithellaceae bacterium]|nr:LapA family protein [Smithellaceae bacterium]HRS83026.1 LapA family protein [Smithellaceae bacterium]HRV45322.1 LapA family protein [Smithellaceae bacterium]